MQFLLDTHAFLWFINDSEVLLTRGLNPLPDDSNPNLFPFPQSALPYTQNDKLSTVVLFK